jgi:PAS domain S-box-containing protein
LDAIITITKEGVIESINPACEKIFGYSKEELIGHKINMLMPEPYCTEHDQYIQNYLTTGIPKVIGSIREVMAKHKDGTEFPIELAMGEVIFGDSRRFTGIIRDITVRHQAQQESKQHLNSLIKSRHNLLTILNQLSIGTVLIDAIGKILFINEACRHFEGVAYEHAINQNWQDIFSFDHISRQKLQLMLSLPYNEQERVTLNWETASGRQYWVEIDIRHVPDNSEQHLIYIYDVSEAHKLREKSEEIHFDYMVGNSPAMLQLYSMIEQVSQGDWTVLITGETGSGKELVARSIHIASSRRKAPFIAINCAGLSESLLNSQLFGHCRGSFTGAVSNQQGFFEAASDGTLFLDEIGDIPISVQTCLLRVLQEQEIIRLGEVNPRKINTRILVATHKDLEQEVVAGRFREDLLYRIRVARIRVPSLRERKEDISLLVNTFLAESRLKAGKTISHVSVEALQVLINYDWPGNIRQLKHTLDFAVIQARQSVIQINDFPPEIVRTNTFSPEIVQTENVLLTDTQEREQVLAALRQTKGNRSKAAKLLGISRATFYRRLKQLEIDISKKAT